MALLSGTLLAKNIVNELKEALIRAPVRPGLAAILVGDYIESHKYVSLKEERATEVGIAFEKHLFPDTVTAATILATIRRLNERDDIHGILVQLPLPGMLPADDIVASIDPTKDVDGFHEATLKKFLSHDPQTFPVFPRAVIELIRATGTNLEGETAVAIVNSDLLGKVMVEALRREGLRAIYVLRSAGREKIAEETRKSRVIVSACGVPHLITAAMLSPQAIVIDGGNVHVDGKVRGDCDRETVLPHVSWLSPVPGGVGPLTIAFLLKRTAELALTNK